MKVGEKRTDSQMETVADPQEYARGRVVLKHPRCGQVVIERQKSGNWKITKCERPDP